ncbi:hypothetical protein, partial [Enterovibrio norvegicus]
GTFIGYIEQPIPFVTWIACTFAGIATTAMIIGFWRRPSKQPVADAKETGAASTSIQQETATPAVATSTAVNG